MAGLTKKKIAEVSLELFSKYGFDSVSVRDISEKLSVTKGALYKHFTDKHAILTYIIERMEKEDFLHANEFDLPAVSIKDDAASYKKAKLKNLVNFTKAQFLYWTTDPFAVRFRRMMTLEQYKSKEGKDLFSQYFGIGPLQYVSDIFSELLGDSEKAKTLALEFYSPVFFLYLVCDSTDNKEEAEKEFDSLLNGFICRFNEVENDK